MFKNRSTKELLGQVATPKLPNDQSPKKEKDHKPAFSIGKIFRNRLLLAGLCIAAAFIFAFAVVPLVQSYVSRSVDVVRLKADVNTGELLNEQSLEIVTVGGLNVPDGAVSDINDALSKYARLDMLSGDILTEKKISHDIVTDDRFLLELPDGMMAMSVTVDGIAQSVSGKLRAGDVVRIFAKAEPDGEVKTAAVSPAELQYVEVLAVTNGSMSDIENGTKNNPDIDSSDKQIATVTLCVNANQALALTALGSTTHTALVYRGEGEAKTEMLAKQSKHIEDLKGGN